jgi:hypothetical protein
MRIALYRVTTFPAAYRLTGRIASVSLSGAPHAFSGLIPQQIIRAWLAPLAKPYRPVWQLPYWEVSFIEWFIGLASRANHGDTPFWCEQNITARIISRATPINNVINRL